MWTTKRRKDCANLTQLNETRKTHFFAQNVDLRLISISGWQSIIPYHNHNTRQHEPYQSTRSLSFTTTRAIGFWFFSPHSQECFLVTTCSLRHFNHTEFSHKNISFRCWSVGFDLFSTVWYEQEENGKTVVVLTDGVVWVLWRQHYSFCDCCCVWLSVNWATYRSLFVHVMSCTSPWMVACFVRWHFAVVDAAGCRAAAVAADATEVALAVGLHCTMYPFHRNMHEISLSHPAS